MEEQYLLPMFNLDDRLILNRGENRKLLVAEWQRLTGKKGSEFDVICGELTAHEYKELFGRSDVTVVPKEAKLSKKQLLNRVQTTLLAQLEVEQIKDFESKVGIVSQFFIEHRISKLADFILKQRGLRT
ncbi:MAG: hypothetical protein AAF518_15920 [Spirochaetota bacterium]